jgi:hypothetical protein
MMARERLEPTSFEANLGKRTLGGMSKTLLKSKF